MLAQKDEKNLLLFSKIGLSLETMTSSINELYISHDNAKHVLTLVLLSNKRKHGTAKLTLHVAKKK